MFDIKLVPQLRLCKPSVSTHSKVFHESKCQKIETSVMRNCLLNSTMSPCLVNGFPSAVLRSIMSDPCNLVRIAAVGGRGEVMCLIIKFSV